MGCLPWKESKYGHSQGLVTQSHATGSDRKRVKPVFGVLRKYDVVVDGAVSKDSAETERAGQSLASIRAPQAHMCGSHIATPRRKPTATRTYSSSSLSPHAVIGKA